MTYFLFPVIFPNLFFLSPIYFVRIHPVFLSSSLAATGLLAGSPTKAADEILKLFQSIF